MRIPSDLRGSYVPDELLMRDPSSPEATGEALRKAEMLALEAIGRRPRDSAVIGSGGA